MEHVHSAHVATDPDRLFAALSQPGDLTKFVPQLTAVTPQDGETVEVEARYGGTTQKGEAYFRADEGARKVEWGAEGGYAGSLTIEPDGDGSMVTLSLHTTHTDHADQDVAGTLDAIRRLAEAKA
jgi:hypothetical protein